MPQDPSVQDLIRQEATKQKVPPELALAVADQESGFNPTLKGTSGELGVMQLMPNTAKRYGVDPANPIDNIRGGVQHLRYLLDTYKGDLPKVLSAYNAGEGRATTPPASTANTYVPGVLGRLSKYSTPAATPPPTPSTSASSIAPPPSPTNQTRPPSSALTRKTYTGSPPSAKEMAAGAEVFPKQGGMGEMISGAGGAAALTAVAPELELPALLSRAYTAAVPLAGAYLGGASHAAANGAQDWPTIQQAGRRQLYYDAAGQAITGVGQAAGRRVAASGIGSKVRDSLLEGLDTIKTRLGSTQPAVTPARAGQLVEGVAQGPAKAVKDQLGEAVGETAKSGPAIPTKPLLDRLEDLSKQITPMASHEPAALETVAQASEPVAESGIKSDLATRKSTSGALTPAELKDLLAQSTGPDHPLPGVLSDIYQKITENPHIEFEDAHKMKRLLDDAVDWDSPAKKQVEQITKGFRVTLRDLMAAHEPYNQATSDYAQVAKLYKKGITPKLHRAILDDPEVAVRKLSWQHPSQAGLLKNLTVDTAAQAGEQGAQQGEAAWNALRASYTHEKLVTKGPVAMINEMRKMEASGNGQQFVKTMYGDPAGQTVWNNLKQIGETFEGLQGKLGEFEKSSLANPPNAATAGRDLAYGIALPGHPITKVGAIFRSLKGPKVNDLVQWAAYTPQRTQWLIKALTGPEPGMALADLSRLVFPGRSEEPAQPVGPPPKPTTVQASVP